MHRPARSSGVRRSIWLFRLFWHEQSDPESFYTALAEDTIAQIERHMLISGKVVLDIGGGSGFCAEVFRANGARCYLMEPDVRELLSRGHAPAGAVIADGYSLPMADAAADICLSSNVLEHVRDPLGLIQEMVRVTRPGGLIYLSFTNWYSPWGGHETSPWHYLGTPLAERRYVRRTGHPPKNRYGTNLYPVHVGQTLRLLRARDDVEIIDAMPRYYPRWCRMALRLPGIREVVTWNLMAILRRTQ